MSYAVNHRNTSHLTTSMRGIRALNFKNARKRASERRTHAARRAARKKRPRPAGAAGPGPGN
eukprot:scaffold88972_cov24-Phaeocystis_antarctica.AAC.1